MACLELRKDSRWWYGRYRARGKIKVVNLGVEIRGHPPTSIRDVGDPRFENSRGEARAALDKLVAGVTGKQRLERLAQEVYEARMGTRVGSIALRDMPGSWCGLPRRRQPTPRYMRQATSNLRRFTRFATAQHGLTAMHEVTEAVAAAFMREEEQRGVSPRTYNDTLETLRHAFRALGKAAGLAGNPCGTGTPSG